MMTGAMHGAGWIFMILFWTLILLGIVALEKLLFSAGSAAEQHGRERLDTLKQRDMPAARSAGTSTRKFGGSFRILKDRIHFRVATV